MNNDLLTEEELQIIIDDDELFDEYDLKNMYSVLDKAIEKKCSVCSILYKGNENLFYSYHNTYCKKCNKKNTKLYYEQNKEKMNGYATEYNKRRRAMYSIL